MNEGNLMLTVIHKYPLSLESEQTISMPKDAIVLCVMDQRGVITLWASHIVGGAEAEDRTFYVRGTGHQFIDSMTTQHSYVGTVSQNNGHHIWHVFEKSDWKSDWQLAE